MLAGFGLLSNLGSAHDVPEIISLRFCPEYGYPMKNDVPGSRRMQVRTPIASETSGEFVRQDPTLELRLNLLP